MEILGSGSAVSLKDSAALVRLGNTAVRLADKAAKASGFADGNGTAERMATEFWEALRYKCVESEAEQIRSIFADRFVRRLGGDEEVPDVNVEVVSAAEPQNEIAVKEDPPSEEKVEQKPAETATKPVDETEPLRFEQCTVTMVVNLLPSENGRRTAVVSLRTHDFAPQINVCTVEDGNIPDGLFPALNDSISQYRARLPELAIEKLRAEKATAKKKSSSKQAKSEKSAVDPKNAQPVAENLF